MSSFQHACFIHGGREAVALCLECRRAFCRECVVDHDGRLICATCLTRLRHKPERAPGAFRSFLRTLGVAAALLLCWMIFYLGARAIVTTDTSRHTFSSSPESERQ